MGIVYPNGQIGNIIHMTRNHYFEINNTRYVIQIIIKMLYIGITLYRIQYIIDPIIMRRTQSLSHIFVFFSIGMGITKLMTHMAIAGVFHITLCNRVAREGDSIGGLRYEKILTKIPLLNDSLWHKLLNKIT